MPIHTHPEYRESVLFLRAIANERRFALTCFFLKGKILLCTDAADLLNIHVTSMSRHLHRLLRAGIIVGNRKAGTVEFRITPDFKKKLKRALALLA